MYITSEQHTKLVQGLFDKMIELKKEGVLQLKQYEIAFQDIIERVFPDMCWWEVTECEIFQHLMEHRSPDATIIAILKGLKEE